MRSGLPKEALLAACFVVFPMSASAQFAPGKLSKAHSDLGGVTECFKCHEPRKATTSDRCLDCHQELASRIRAGNGLHGHLPPAQHQVCGECHREHGGEAASIIAWPGGRDRFDHRRTGYDLDGKHSALSCAACHRADRIRARDVRASKTIDLDHTYLGLSTRCADCHNEPHHGQFEALLRQGDCRSCHDTAGWRIETFPHDRARFRLEGKHVAVACDRCHPRVDPGGRVVATGTTGSFVRYRPLESSSCASCHKDPHEGRHGTRCADCHSPKAWRDLSLARFDHGRTRFPLEGRHTSLACELCHWSENAAGKKVTKTTADARVHWKPIPFQQCTGCHKDAHQTRLGVDCARCHTPVAWNRIQKGTFDHDRTRYPLRGRHRDVLCAKCHKDREGRQPLKFTTCRDCHADAHRGQLAQRQDHGACESCHDVEGFVPARFGPQEHESARFPLREAHLALACTDCHRAGKGEFAMRLENRTCSACHRDPHGGQFARDDQTDCARCHNGSTWRLSPFDHSKTRFPLDGAHMRAACSACHKQEKRNGQIVVHYVPLDTACRSCHAQQK